MKPDEEDERYSPWKVHIHTANTQCDESISHNLLTLMIHAFGRIWDYQFLEDHDLDLCREMLPFPPHFSRDQVQNQENREKKKKKRGT